MYSVVERLELFFFFNLQMNVSGIFIYECLEHYSLMHAVFMNKVTVITVTKVPCYIEL